MTSSDLSLVRAAIVVSSLVIGSIVGFISTGDTGSIGAPPSSVGDDEGEDPVAPSVEPESDFADGDVGNSELVQPDSPLRNGAGAADSARYRDLLTQVVSPGQPASRLTGSVPADLEQQMLDSLRSSGFGYFEFETEAQEIVDQLVQRLEAGEPSASELFTTLSALGGAVQPVDPVEPDSDGPTENG